MLSYPCPFCGDRQTAPEDHAGERTLCTKCFRSLVIPDAAVPVHGTPAGGSDLVALTPADPPVPRPVPPPPARPSAWPAVAAAAVLTALAFAGPYFAFRHLTRSAAPPTAAEPAPTGPLAKLRAARDRNDAVLVIAALHDLANPTAFPTADRAEVVAELKRAAEDDRPDVRAAGLAALAAWFQADAREKVIVALNSVDGIERRAALTVAGRFADAGMAKAVAARFPDRDDRAAAADALVRIGPAAEAAVLPLLNSPDAVMVLEACEVLEKINGPAAAEALAALAKATRDPVIRAGAERAAKAIAPR